MESSLVTYHSSFCDREAELACGIPLLPLNGKAPGPAPKSDEAIDIVDEAINLFRATILFKNFQPKGPADKCIVYLTCFIQKCLQEIQRKGIDCPEAKAKEAVDMLVKEAVPISTDSTFFMRNLGQMTQPKGPAEEDKCRKYLMQLKVECGARLIATLYANQAMDLKFWLGFGKRPFLGQKFNNKL